MRIKKTRAPQSNGCAEPWSAPYVARVLEGKLGCLFEEATLLLAASFGLFLQNNLGFRAEEMLGCILGSIHNLYFINHLVMKMRQAIIDDNFSEFKESFLKGYGN